jgi:hypothetical protein
VSNVSSDVSEAVSVLLEADVNQLLEQLGLRSQLVESNLDATARVLPGVLDVDELVSREDLRELGKRIFSEMSVAAWHLVCGSDAADTNDRRAFLQSFAQGPVAISAYLTVALIAVGIAPLFAPVIAALIVKLFLKPTYEATCAFWKERLGT